MNFFPKGLFLLAQPVQAVSPQVTLGHPPGGRLPLLPTGLLVTFLAEERHRPLAGTKLYCLVTEAHACEQLAQGYYLSHYVKTRRIFVFLANGCFCYSIASVYTAFVFVWNLGC